MTLRDVHRGAPARQAPSLRSAIAMLVSSRAFLLIVFGTALLSFVTYGAMAFAGSFYLPIHLAALPAIGAQIGPAPLGVVGLALCLPGPTGSSEGLRGGQGF